jgi:hypothetical protein
MVTWLSVIVAAVCLLAAAQSRLKSDEEGKILALENAWNLAEAHKDIKALDHLLAENVVYIEYDGTLMNKSRFLASIQDSSYRPGQIVNENMSVHVYGDIAIGTAAYWEKALRRASHTSAAHVLQILGYTGMAYGSVWTASLLPSADESVSKPLLQSVPSTDRKFWTVRTQPATSVRLGCGPPL